MPKKNIELLKRLRTRFLRMRHPKHFNMKPIAMETNCGTAMCIAGHTLDLAGYKMRKRERPNSTWDGITGRMDFDFISPTGRVVDDPLKTAARELGLRFSGTGICGLEADQLFHDFSLKTPKQAAQRIEALIKDSVPAR